jgi:hypothetical protein
MRFTKPTVTRSLGAEPMVSLDALALTQRIGSISHVEKPVTSPIYQSLTARQQPYEAKWRRALKPR